MGEQPMPVVTRHQKAQNTASWARANSKLINLEPKDTTPCEKCCEKPHEGAMILGFTSKTVHFAVERTSCSKCEQKLCFECARICFEQKHKIQGTFTSWHIHFENVHVDDVSVICTHENALTRQIDIPGSPK